MNPPDNEPKPKKKPYRRPTLRKLGSVAELTGTPGTSFQAVDPSFPGINQKHFP
jgi:hypothetical protein